MDRWDCLFARQPVPSEPRSSEINIVRRGPVNGDLVRRNMMIRTRIMSISLVLILLCSNVVQARLRFRYEDATVVDRSELIVVGHLKEGSIHHVPHKKKPHEGASWEHRAVLGITKVLKGKCSKAKIPIIIHYGLDPRVGGVSVAHGSRPPHAHFPKEDGAIYILDTGASISSGHPLVSDAGKDNLWFLRKRTGVFGEKPGAGDYGIVDPEDLQPLEWKDYFLAYMADDPEAAVKDWSEGNPEEAGRAKRYLAHLEVQRILKTEDPEERYDKLLPFFLSRTTWNMKFEAKDGIVSCGQAAGERLKKVFDDADRDAFRDDIILMWRDIGYSEAVPLLVHLLKKHDEFLGAQDLQKGWWNSDVASDQTRHRRDIYGEVYYGVCALRSFKDPRAKDVLKMTRDRWKAIGFDNPQIVEGCEAVLRELYARKGDAQQGAPVDMDKPRR